MICALWQVLSEADAEESIGEGMGEPQEMRDGKCSRSTGSGTC